MMLESVLSHSSSLRSKIGYGTSVINALDTSVAGSPNIAGETLLVRNAVAGCMMSSRYSTGTRSVSSSHPDTDIIAEPLPSVTVISHRCDLGVTPVSRR